MSSRARICIVTPTHISANPRVVKEADALTDAGYDVCVISVQGSSAEDRSHDATVFRGKEWQWAPVLPSAPQLMTRAGKEARYRIAKLLPSNTWDLGTIVEFAQCRPFAALAATAFEKSAALYIGHYPGGLAAAAHAASRRRARLAFDAEDFHTGEANSPRELARVDLLQRRYLPMCSFVTAASRGISAALAERYGIGTPTTIHNVFPWAERRLLDGQKKDRSTQALSLYWYSQTIGLDRGIQDAVRAAGILRAPVELHLRGAITPNVRSSLQDLASISGLKSHQLQFHLPVGPAELLARSAEHDVGLALEQGGVLNRQICTTNKIFYYMLAGLAIAATDVPGQAAVMSESPAIGAQYSPGDHIGLARIIDKWLNSPGTLSQTRAAALEAARTRWNWELEKERLIDKVNEALRARARVDGSVRQPACYDA